MDSGDLPNGYMVEEAMAGDHYWVLKGNKMVLILLGHMGVLTKKYRAWESEHTDGYFEHGEVTSIAPGTFLWRAEDLDGRLIPAPPVPVLADVPVVSVTDRKRTPFVGLAEYFANGPDAPW